MLDARTIPRGQRQPAAYLLNLLHWRWLCWQANAEGFVQLKAAYLCKVIPPEVWPRLWRRLEALGVVEIDGRVAVGSKCRGYRLAPGYRETRRIECSNLALARRIEKVYAKERGAYLPVHRWLEEKLALLDFDAERAAGIIAELEPDAGSKEPADVYRVMLGEAAKRIANGDHTLGCDAYGRVHTPLTNLVSELRCCLAVGNEPLMGLDIANCQPLLAGMVAREFYASKRKAARLQHRKFERGRNPYHRRRLTCAELPPDRLDLKLYLKVCQQGRLYESLMRPGEERETFKKQFLAMMYGEKVHWGSRLKSAYPSIAEMLAELKKSNYRHAAHLMQNAESVIVIHGIADRLRRERPEMPLYTIHDALLTTPAHAECLEGIILDEFRKLGIRPTLKREDYA